MRNPSRWGDSTEYLTSYSPGHLLCIIWIDTECGWTVMWSLIWILSSFQKQTLRLRNNSGAHRGCFLCPLPCLHHSAKSFYIMKKSCLSSAGADLWYPRNPTMTEKNRWSQQSRITSTFMALSFDREGRSFPEFIHNAAPALNPLEIAPWCPASLKSRRVAAALERHKSDSE